MTNEESRERTGKKKLRVEFCCLLPHHQPFIKSVVPQRTGYCSTCLNRNIRLNSWSPSQTLTIEWTHGSVGWPGVREWWLVVWFLSLWNAISYPRNLVQISVTDASVHSALCCPNGYDNRALLCVHFFQQPVLKHCPWTFWFDRDFGWDG